MTRNGNAERQQRQAMIVSAGTGARAVAGRRWWHATLAWLAGSVCAYALASIAHTQTVLAGLVALDVDMPLGTRLATTAADLIGLWRYGVVIAIGLALGLVVLRLLPRPIRTLPRIVRGALAGTLAIATALLAMRLALSFTPIASARGNAGFALQCLAGTTGGLVWARICNRLATVSLRAPD